MTEIFIIILLFLGIINSILLLNLISDLYDVRADLYYYAETKGDDKDDL